MRLDETPEQVAIAGLLAVYDAACAPCPVAKGKVGGKDCPNCGANTSQACGLEASASYALIKSLRAHLTPQEPA